MARAGIQPSDKQSENEAHSVTTLFAPSLIFCWLPKSNGEYNTALLNKILLRRCFTSKEEVNLLLQGHYSHQLKWLIVCPQKNLHDAEIVAV